MWCVQASNMRIDLVYPWARRTKKSMKRVSNGVTGFKRNHSHYTQCTLNRTLSDQFGQKCWPESVFFSCIQLLTTIFVCPIARFMQITQQISIHSYHFVDLVSQFAIRIPLTYWFPSLQSFRCCPTLKWIPCSKISIKQMNFIFSQQITLFLTTLSLYNTQTQAQCDRSVKLEWTKSETFDWCPSTSIWHCVHPEPVLRVSKLFWKLFLFWFRSAMVVSLFMRIHTHTRILSYIHAHEYNIAIRSTWPTNTLISH